MDYRHGQQQEPVKYRNVLLSNWDGKFLYYQLAWTPIFIDRQIVWDLYAKHVGDVSYPEQPSSSPFAEEEECVKVDMKNDDVTAEIYCDDVLLDLEETNNAQNSSSITRKRKKNVQRIGYATEMESIATIGNRYMVSSKSTLQAERDVMHTGGVHVPVDDPEPGRRTHNKTDACVQEEHNSLVEGGGLLCFAAADESPNDAYNISSKEYSDMNSVYYCSEIFHQEEVLQSKIHDTRSRCFNNGVLPIISINSIEKAKQDLLRFADANVEHHSYQRVNFTRHRGRKKISQQPDCEPPLVSLSDAIPRTTDTDRQIQYIKAHVPDVRHRFSDGGEFFNDRANTDTDTDSYVPRSRLKLGFQVHPDDLHGELFVEMLRRIYYLLYFVSNRRISASSFGDVNLIPEEVGFTGTSYFRSATSYYAENIAQYHGVYSVSMGVTCYMQHSGNHDRAFSDIDDAEPATVITAQVFEECSGIEAPAMTVNSDEHDAVDGKEASSFAFPALNILSFAQINQDLICLRAFEKQESDKRRDAIKANTVESKIDRLRQRKEVLRVDKIHLEAKILSLSNQLDSFAVAQRKSPEEILLQDCESFRNKSFVVNTEEEEDRRDRIGRETLLRNNKEELKKFCATETAKLNDLIKARNDEINEIEAKLVIIAADISNFEALKYRYEKMEQEKKTLHEKIAKIERDLDSTNFQKKVLDTIREGQWGSLWTLENSIRTVQSEANERLRRMNEELCKIEEKYSDLPKRIENQESVVHQMHERLNDPMLQITVAVSLLSIGLSAISDLQREFRKQKDILSDLKTNSQKCESLRSEISELQDGLNKYNQKVKKLEDIFSSINKDKPLQYNLNSCHDHLEVLIARANASLRLYKQEIGKFDGGNQTKLNSTLEKLVKSEKSRKDLVGKLAILVDKKTKLSQQLSKIALLQQQQQQRLGGQFSITSISQAVLGDRSSSSNLEPTGTHHSTVESFTPPAVTQLSLVTEMSNLEQDISSNDTEVDWIDAELVKLSSVERSLDSNILSDLLKEDSMLLLSDQKLLLLQEVHIANHGLLVMGSEASHVEPIDNLLQCILAIQQDKLVVHSLSSAGQSKAAVEPTQSFSSLKQQLKLEIDCSINQILIDRIIAFAGFGKNFKLFLVESDMQTTTSYDSKDGTVLLFRIQNEFYSLAPAIHPTNSLIVTTAVNKLIFEEVLQPLCIGKFAQLCKQTHIEQIKLEVIHDTYQQIVKDVKSFGENILDALRYFQVEFSEESQERHKHDIVVKLANHSIALILNAVLNVKQYSQEYNAIVNKVVFLIGRYEMGIQSVLFNEIARRKKEYESSNNVSDKSMLQQQHFSDLAHADKKIKDIDMELQKVEDRIKQLSMMPKQLTEAFEAQDAAISSDIASSKVKLEELQQATRKDVDNQSKDVDNQLLEIGSLQKQQDELKIVLKTLQGSKDTLDLELYELSKRREDLKASQASLRCAKQLQQEKFNSLSVTIKEMELWQEFLSGVYDQLLDSHDLFRQRAVIFSELQSRVSLKEKVDYLKRLDDVRHLVTEGVTAISTRNCTAKLSNFNNYLASILRGPIVEFDNVKDIGVATIKEININYTDVEAALKTTVCTLISKAEFQFGDDVLTTTSKLTITKLLRNPKLPVQLKELILKQINIKFLIKKNAKNDDSSESSAVTHPVMHTTSNLSHYCIIEADGITVKKLIHFSTAEVFKMLSLTYHDVLRCFVSSVRCFASNKIYVDVEKVSLPGINISLSAENDIVLQKGIVIDTAASYSGQFKFKQAFGEPKPHASSKVDGVSGVNGLDGFSGGNGGQIYFNAERTLVNLKEIASIDSSGGNGSDGQIGGNGQEGGKGIDHGDAVAEPFGPCFFAPSFVIAFARPPGFDPVTQKFDAKLSEFSGGGGNAGSCGYHGQGGTFGKLLLKDSIHVIRNMDGNDNDKLFVCEALKEATLLSNIKQSKGASGTDAPLLGKGGVGGKPGSYGCDHVIYIDGFYRAITNKKGDYSNYLLETPTGVNPAIKIDCSASKYKSTNRVSASDTDTQEVQIKEGSIANPGSCDLYAKRSASFDVQNGVATVFLAAAAITIFCVLLAPAIACAPAIGIAAVAQGIVVGGAVPIYLGGLALAVSSGIICYTSACGTDVNVGLKNDKAKVTNKNQVKFSNRYCDFEPLRNEKDTRENARFDDRSRGRRGNNSAVKKAAEKQSHSKIQSTDVNFMLNTESEFTLFKSSETKTDSVKEKEHKAIADKIADLQAQLTTSSTALSEAVVQENQLNSSFLATDNLISRKTAKLARVNASISETTAIFVSNESKLFQKQSDVIQSVAAVLQTAFESAEVKLEQEFLELKISGRCETKEACMSKFHELKERTQTTVTQAAFEKSELITKKTAAVNERTELVGRSYKMDRADLQNTLNSINRGHEMTLASEILSRLNSGTTGQLMESSNTIMLMQDDCKVRDCMISKSITLKNNSTSSMSIATSPGTEVINDDPKMPQYGLTHFSLNFKCCKKLNISKNECIGCSEMGLLTNVLKVCEVPSSISLPFLLDYIYLLEDSAATQSFPFYCDALNVVITYLECVKVQSYHAWLKHLSWLEKLVSILSNRCEVELYKYIGDLHNDSDMSRSFNGLILSRLDTGLPLLERSNRRLALYQQISASILVFKEHPDQLHMMLDVTFKLATTVSVQQVCFSAFAEDELQRLYELDIIKVGAKQSNAAIFESTVFYICRKLMEMSSETDTIQAKFERLLQFQHKQLRRSTMMSIIIAFIDSLESQQRKQSQVKQFAENISPEDFLEALHTMVNWKEESVVKSETRARLLDMIDQIYFAKYCTDVVGANTFMLGVFERLDKCSPLRRDELCFLWDKALGYFRCHELIVRNEYNEVVRILQSLTGLQNKPKGVAESISAVCSSLCAVLKKQLLRAVESPSKTYLLQQVLSTAIVTLCNETFDGDISEKYGVLDCSRLLQLLQSLEVSSDKVSTLSDGPASTVSDVESNIIKATKAKVYALLTTLTAWTDPKFDSLEDLLQRQVTSPSIRRLAYARVVSLLEFELAACDKDNSVVKSKIDSFETGLEYIVCKLNSETQCENNQSLLLFADELTAMLDAQLLRAVSKELVQLVDHGTTLNKECEKIRDEIILNHSRNISSNCKHSAKSRSNFFNQLIHKLHFHLTKHRSTMELIDHWRRLCSDFKNFSIDKIEELFIAENNKFAFINLKTEIDKYFCVQCTAETAESIIQEFASNIKSKILTPMNDSELGSVLKELYKGLKLVVDNFFTTRIDVIVSLRDEIMSFAIQFETKYDKCSADILNSLDEIDHLLKKVCFRQQNYLVYLETAVPVCSTMVLDLEKLVTSQVRFVLEAFNNTRRNKGLFIKKYDHVHSIVIHIAGKMKSEIENESFESIAKSFEKIIAFVISAVDSGKSNLSKYAAVARSNYSQLMDLANVPRDVEKLSLYYEMYQKQRIDESMLDVTSYNFHKEYEARLLLLFREYVEDWVYDSNSNLAYETTDSRSVLLMAKSKFIDSVFQILQSAVNKQLQIRLYYTLMKQSLDENPIGEGNVSQLIGAVSGGRSSRNLIDSIDYLLKDSLLSDKDMSEVLQVTICLFRLYDRFDYVTSLKDAINTLREKLKSVVAVQDSKNVKRIFLTLNTVLIQYYKSTNHLISVDLKPLADRVMILLAKQFKDYDHSCALLTDYNCFLDQILCGFTESYSSTLESLFSGLSSYKSVLLPAEMVYVDAVDPTTLQSVMHCSSVLSWRDCFENEFIKAMNALIWNSRCLSTSCYSNEKLKVLCSNIVASSFFDDCDVAVNELVVFTNNLSNVEAVRTSLLSLSYSGLPEPLLECLRLSKLAKSWQGMFKAMLVAKERLFTKPRYWLKITKSLCYLVSSFRLSFTAAGYCFSLTPFIKKLDSLLTVLEEIELNNMDTTAAERTVGLFFITVVRDAAMDSNKRTCREETSKCFQLVADLWRLPCIDPQNEMLWLVVEYLASEFVLRESLFESNEADLLVQILSMACKLRVFDDAAMIEKMRSAPLWKWRKMLLLAFKIGYELSRKDSHIIRNVLYLQKVQGEGVTQRLVNLIRSSEVNDDILCSMLNNFKQKEWELSNALIDKLCGERVVDWFDTIHRHEMSMKERDLTITEIVDELKRFEGFGEANYSLRELLKRGNDNLCVLERCLHTLDQSVPTSVYNSRSTAFAGCSTCSFHEYEKSDIELWVKDFTTQNEKGVNGIESTDILELVAVISRAAAIVSGHKEGLRNTQRSALLLFIDSMLINKGRLGNIGTGEGKSTITIVSAIARILIKGGTVDILTSSEILAVRDVIASIPLFNLFHINASNNCDEETQSNEKLRKARYEENQVIFGEIGFFQRDILLTKYFGKSIRNKLASCLLVDEVDSMCIDNVCNTLYISHTIADLGYLKEIYLFIWQAIHIKGTDVQNKASVKQVMLLVQQLIVENHIRFPSNLREFVTRRLQIWVENAFLAKEMKSEDQYSILTSGRRTGDAVINDLQTGVEQLNTQWSNGLQQFIQLKHTNKLSDESLKAIFMSNYIFFTEYGCNIYGMTGTIGVANERGLLSSSYGLDFFQLCRFRKELNKRLESVVFSKKESWLDCIYKEVEHHTLNSFRDITQESFDAEKLLSSLEAGLQIVNEQIESVAGEESDPETVQRLLSTRVSIEKQMHDAKAVLNSSFESDGRVKSSRAVLLICENKRDLHSIFKAIMKKGKHRHVYQYTGALEGLMKVNFETGCKVHATVDQLKPSDVVIATNIAGRGTDFLLSKLLVKNGGLHVIMAYIPSNIRIEQQGFGRSGRNGQPGSGRTIAYQPSRENTHIDDLVDERDDREEQRLLSVRLKKIPKVLLERDLFQEFDKLHKFCGDFFSKFNAEYKALQMASLSNKWAFWLDKMDTEMDDASKRELIFEKYDAWMKGIKEQVGNDKGGRRLIDELGEIIKLVKHLIDEGLFGLAILNCDHCIDTFGNSFAMFPLYYKAIAFLQPLKDEQKAGVVQMYAHKFFGHIVSFREKVKVMRLFKQAQILFNSEIARVQQRTVILAGISTLKTSSGVGSTADYFSRSNADEIAVLNAFLNVIRTSIGSEFKDDMIKLALDGSLLTDEERGKIANQITAGLSAKGMIKDRRVSKKVSLKIHVAIPKKPEKLLDILKTVVSAEEMKSIQKKLYKYQDEKDFLVLDELSDSILGALKANVIRHSLEIYVSERLVVGEMHHVPFPSPFLYCKDLIISSWMKPLLRYESIGNCSATSSETRIDMITTLKSCLLSPEHIWKMVHELGVMKWLRFKQEYLSSDGVALKESNILSDTTSEKQRLSLFSDLQSKATLLEKEKYFVSQEEFEKCWELAGLSGVSFESFRKELFEDEVHYCFTATAQEKLHRYTTAIKVNQIEAVKELTVETFEEFTLLKTKSEPLLQFIFSADTISVHDIEGIYGGDQDCYQLFHILRKLLLVKGCADPLLPLDRIHEFAKFDLGRPFQAIFMQRLEHELELLYESNIFRPSDIQLDSAERLVDILTRSEVIKSKSIKYKLSRGMVETRMQQVWQDLCEEFYGKPMQNKAFLVKVADVTSEHVTPAIRSLPIEKFVSTDEVNAEYDSYVQQVGYCITAAGALLSIGSPVCTLPLIAGMIANFSASSMDGGFSCCSKEQAKQVFDILRDEKKTKSEIQAKLWADGQTKAIHDGVRNISDVIMNSIGNIKSMEMCTVQSGTLSDMFQGGNIPKEVFAYENQYKCLVINFMGYTSPWDWKAFAIAAFGVLQIIAGAVIMVYCTGFLGPFAYHLGSGLIAEGLSDLSYAVMNAGNISWSDYGTQKLVSCVITACTIGVGAYLSKGAKTAKMSVDIGKEFVSRSAMKAGTKSIGATVIKKIFGEVLKGSVNAIQSLVVESVSKIVTDSLFAQFHESIMKMVRSTDSYLSNNVEVESTLRSLQSEVLDFERDTKFDVKTILTEKLNNTEETVNDSLSQQIVKYTGSIGGPLASQLQEAASTLHYNNPTESANLKVIAAGISTALKFIKHCNNAYQLVVIVGNLLTELNKKLRKVISNLGSQTDKALLSADRSVPVEKRKEEMKDCMIMVDSRIEANIKQHINTAITSQVFTALVDYAMQPFHDKLQETFLDDFNELKRRALAEGELNALQAMDPLQIGSDIEAKIEFYMLELSNFSFRNPVAEMDLDDIPDDVHLELILNDDEIADEHLQPRVLDMSKQKNRDLLRDVIGDRNIRILPGKPYRIVRPNYPSYLKSLTERKQTNEFDLLVMARHTRVQIMVHSDGETKLIGDNDGNTAVIHILNMTNPDGTKHFVPLIPDFNGNIVPVENLPNIDKACGVNSVLYHMITKDLRNLDEHKDKSDDQIDELVRSKLGGKDSDGIRKKFLQDVAETALGSSSLRKSFLGRGHENRHIIGGVNQNLNWPVPTLNPKTNNNNDSNSNLVSFANNTTWGAAILKHNEFNGFHVTLAANENGIAKCIPTSLTSEEMRNKLDHIDTHVTFERPKVQGGNLHYYPNRKNTRNHETIVEDAKGHQIGTVSADLESVQKDIMIRLWNEIKSRASQN